MLRFAAKCPECGHIAMRTPEGGYPMSVQQWQAMQNDLDEVELMCDHNHKFKMLYKDLSAVQSEDE
jgi:hypothetical protein